MPELCVKQTALRYVNCRLPRICVLALSSIIRNIAHVKFRQLYFSLAQISRFLINHKSLKQDRPAVIVAQCVLAHRHDPHYEIQI